MIYAAYAILCKTPVAWGVLALFVLVTFVPNMVRALACVINWFRVPGCPLTDSRPLPLSPHRSRRTSR